MEIHDMTELSCTRVIHDLAGDVGSISNALEMLDDDPTELEDSILLIRESSRTLSARLKFFRLAFGLKNAAPKEMTTLQVIIENYLKTVCNPENPIHITFHLQNISLYKIVLLSVMALADTCIKGGHIDVTEKEDGLSFVLTSDFKLSESKLQNIIQSSKGERSEDNPALIAPVFYLQNLLHAVNADMNLTFDSKRAELTIS